VSGPLLSVVIVTHDSAAMIRRCLEPLQALAIPHEVVIVDNASSDDSLEMTRGSCPSAERVPLERNAGFAAAANAGAARAHGTLLLFLNPDAIATPEAIEVLCRHLDGHPEAAAVGPRLDRPDGRPRAMGLRRPSLREVVLGLLLLDLAGRRGWGRAPRSAGVVECLEGCCLMVRGAAFRAVGGFDERYFLYFEDTDLCARLVAAGWQVRIAPEARVVHLGQSGSGHYDAMRTLQFHRSALLWLAGHETPRRARWFRELMGLRAAERAALLQLAAAVWAPRASAWRARACGFRDAARLMWSGRA